MKINKIKTIFTLMLIIISTVGCNEFLDKEPYTVSPVSFFNNAAQLNAYVVPRYEMFSYATGWNLGPNAERDAHTDNQSYSDGEDRDTRWLPGEWRVDNSSNWDWENIYDINYFFQQVMPKYDAGEITGDLILIDHYIGEMHFFRAYAYFSKLKSIGDSPIVLDALVDQKETLLEASVRQPRHLVARQIIKDLDEAIRLLQASPSEGNNRVSKNLALLFKSRVALYEASWERNFAGTAFVPNGEGWPGKTAHPNLSYNAETEINFFLDQALKAAEVVADAIPLTENPASYDYKDGSKVGNKYYEMFGTTGLGLKGFPEVLLFKSYDIALDISHNMVHYLIGDGTGLTNQYMKNFLMANGLPIYATGSGYKGDVKIEDIKAGRDNRLQLFVQAPGEVLNDAGLETHIVPDLLASSEYVNPTGYSIKKRASVDSKQFIPDHSGTTGDVLFRGVEAYLNYIEAYYLKHGSVGGKADSYWKAIRRRANVSEDYMATVAATVMTEEAKVDLAAYTAGQLITPLEYNIRRERRSEFIAEGFRTDDLYRYRALDQLISERVFIPQGINLWDETYKIKHEWFYDKDGNSLFIPAPAADANISENKDFTAKHGELMEGKYAYPLRAKITNNLYFDGYTFAAAHYLYPIGVTHILNAAKGDVVIENSVIFQNPGWGTIAGEGAQAVVGFQ